MSQYFIPLNQVQIGSAIVRNRFVFVDWKGLTCLPNDTTPLGVYYYTNSPIIPAGYAQYYNLGQNIPVWLELGEDAPTTAFLTYDSLGCGVMANEQTAYAFTLQGGKAGDYVRVLMGIFNTNFQGGFSKGFNEGFSGGI
jgi:hypothetical protein